MGRTSICPQRSQHGSNQHNKEQNEIGNQKVENEDKASENQKGENEVNKSKIKNNENINIMQWNMQRCDFLELDRIATHHKADIIIAQETGVENSEFRETENYYFWTASDKKAKKNKEKDEKEKKESKGNKGAGKEGKKGRGKGKRPREGNEKEFEWWGVLVGIKRKQLATQ